MDIKDTYKQVSKELSTYGLNISISSDKTIKLISVNSYKELLDNLKNSDNYELFNSNVDTTNTLYEFHNVSQDFYIQLIGDFYDRVYKVVITIN